MTAQQITSTAFANKLAEVKQERFSGRLVLKGPLGQEWSFYLYLGRILYATGGVHTVRRWHRNLAVHCFNVGLHQLEQLEVMKELSSLSLDAYKVCWEYQLVCEWLQKQRVTREQVMKMIEASVVEVLFDVTQAMQVSCESKQEPPLAPQLALLDAEKEVTEAQRIWQIWKTARISDLFPDRAPLIKQPEQLKQKTSPAAYQSLTQLLNGQRSLRDIAVQTKKEVTEVTRSLLPYIEAGLVELIGIADLPVPLAPPAKKTPEPAPSAGQLIACVDDSPLVCQTMEKILKAGGYQFLAVQDSMRAIATVLSRKPDLIFLDLVMPNTNGYEICTQLRKVSSFRDTPIIILTGNDGIVDRVRARVVGATDFLGKPVDAETVLGVAAKYLKQAKDSPQVIE